MKLHFKIGKDGNVQGTAICVRTDAWQDHMGLFQDSRSASKIGNSRRAKRFLRASLVFLLAHLESALTACLLSVKHKSDKEIIQAGLASKVDFMNAYLRLNKMGISLDVDEARDLRNIIAHADAFRTGGRLNEVDVFHKLTAGYLKKLSNEIDVFLNRVCKECGVERFSDTAQKLKKIGSAIGKLGTIEEV